MRKRFGKFYHWVVAAVVFLEMIIIGGAINTFSSIYLLPITGALDISRGTYGLAMSTVSMCTLLSNLAAGVLYTRCGYRQLAPIFLVLYGIGLLLVSVAQGLVLLYAGCVLMGLCAGFISVTACARLIGQWFHRNHGLVMGAISSATGLGSSLFSFLLSSIIASAGYRSALYFSIAAVLFAAVLVLVLVRSQPQDMGLLPYGEGEISNKKANANHWSGYTMGQMLRTPVFYLLMLGTFLSCACASTFSSILTPHLQDKGMSAVDAAGAMGYLYLLLTFTKFFIGLLSDRIGPNRASLICLCTCIPALCLMASISGAATAYLAITIAAIALPLTALIAPLLVPYVLGYRCSSIGNGIMLAMAAGGNMLSSTVTNLVYDRFGSYSPFYWVAAAVAVLVLMLYLLMFKLSNRDKKKYNMQPQENEV